MPAELEGTLLRNGPGLFEIGGKRISQPLDGDGQVRPFCLYVWPSYVCQLSVAQDSFYKVFGAVLGQLRVPFKL